MQEFSEKKPNIRQAQDKKHRKDIEKRVREAMLKNPGISLKGLREKVGGGNGLLGTIYNRVLREGFGKK